MSEYPYRKIDSTDFGREFRNKQNLNLLDIETDIKGVFQKSQGLQNQLDTIIIESGTSDAETLQARTKDNGETFPLLKDRLQDVDKQLDKLHNVNMNAVNLIEYADFKVAVAEGYDWLPAWNAALASLSKTTEKIIVFPDAPNMYMSGHVKILDDNTTIIGKGEKCPLKAMANMTPGRSTVNNMGQFFEINMRKNVLITNVHTDGQDYNAGGVCISGSQNVTVHNCYFYNSMQQGINIAIEGSNKTSNINILHCRFFKVRHGVQMWDCDDVFMFRNYAERVIGGGFWHAVSRNIFYISNRALDCGDVGVDMEGGETCEAIGNICMACKNGEFTVFRGAVNNKLYAQHLVFKNNIAIATATYTKRDGTIENCAFGGITIHSINEGATTGVVFENNEVEVWGARYGIYTNQFSLVDGECGLTFKDNNIRVKTETGRGHRFLHCVGVHIDNNKFIFEVANGSVNEIKNCWYAIVKDNFYYFKKGRTTVNPKHAVYLYTDEPGDSSKRLFFRKNTIKGAGQYACMADSFKNWGKNMFVLDDNQFSEKQEINGGLFVTEMFGASFINQRLKILIDVENPVDISTLGMFNQTDVNKRPVAVGQFILKNGGALRNCYSIVYFKNQIRSYDGGGPGSGVVGANDFYVTFDGTTMSFTMHNKIDNASYLDVVLTST